MVNIFYHISNHLLFALFQEVKRTAAKLKLSFNPIYLD